jgi:5-carboxymethyl-2-hydroxymuconic-semialdehyde dehydrogenase
MRIAQDEIFGPVACLIRSTKRKRSPGQRQPLRLSSYVSPRAPRRCAAPGWSRDVFVNSQNVRDLRQPFGGIKASGVGREGGHWSFEVFAEIKNVCVSLGRHPIPRWGA